MVIRFKFKRGEEVKFISHLDLMKTFDRVMRRANIPLSYSNGFNPHPVIVFGLPLSVGVTSESEYADISLDQEMRVDELIDRLNSFSPQGIEIIEGKQKLSTKNIMSEISAASYKISIIRNDINEEFIKNKLEEFLKKEDITIIKTRKNKSKEVNIRPFIHDFKFESITINRVRFSATVDAGSVQNLKPESLIKAFGEICNKEFEIDKIHRIELYVGKRGEYIDPLDDIIIL